MSISKQISRIGIVSALAALASVGIASADPQPPAPQPEQRFVTSDGHVWERIQIQHTDVRSLTLLLGGQVLPTEMDLYRMRMGGYGTFGYGGGYGGMQAAGGPGMGYGSRNMGYGGSGMGYGPGFSGNPMAGYPSGMSILGDPRTNSLLVGPGAGLGMFGGGGAGQGANPGAGAGQGLFPGLIILGDPNTNSLIVDP